MAQRISATIPGRRRILARQTSCIASRARAWGLRRTRGAGGAAFLLATGVAISSTPLRAGEGNPPASPPVGFTDVTKTAGIDFTETLGDPEMSNIVESAGVGCAFLDYDGDGWLDVYLVNGCWREQVSDPTLPADRRAKLAAATDRLYRNRGDGSFEDVTEQAGLNRPAYGMGVTVADIEGDGDPDIYVTNYGRNCLYRNNGDGTFTEMAASAGVADPGFSVGAVFFDYDRDGNLDLYVGNYVIFDPHYRSYYAPDGFPGPLAYTGQQDRLFRGRGDGTFVEVTNDAGIVVEPVGRAMGVGAFDFDGDGWQDVFVSNDAMENFLFRNQQDGTFVNEAWERGVAFGENGEATAAMGVEFGDYDGDGRLDVFVPDMTFSCLYRNVGKGGFEDHAGRSGLAPVMGQYVGWGGVLADFDLDGVLDLYVSNGDVHHLEPHEDVVFLGDGKGRFRDVSETAGTYFQEEHVGRGVAGGDFDNDGDVDVLVTNLNDRPVLLRNDTPRRGRHWLLVNLIGCGGNRDALGAIVELRTPAGTQIRLRRSGGGYLSQHDPRLHFGLGTSRSAEVLTVKWPDGSRQVLRDVRADRIVTIRQTCGEHKGARQAVGPKKAAQR
ncbi:MAG: CRTAC1 family protein [Planctomycetota bacterium]|nr:MAG: CRTAC1 family protein [Planctomycetota bacterium]